MVLGKTFDHLREILKPIMSKKKEELSEETLNSADNAGQNDIAEKEGNSPVEQEANGELDEVAQLKANLAELNDKYLRLYSEFDNFKRRTSRERVELLQSASRDIILALLPVLDDFERAEKSIENAKNLEAVREGVELVHHKLKNILAQNGLQALDSVGKEFDVDFHEAITKIPAPSEEMKGKVVDEVERGYQLRDKVIRFAKVVVGE